MSESTPPPESDAPDATDREAVHEETGMTDPVAADEGGSGTAGPPTDEKDQAGAYSRDAEQDPAGERHSRDDADTHT
jgi:hypothetical protein